MNNSRTLLALLPSWLASQPSTSQRRPKPMAMSP